MLSLSPVWGSSCPPGIKFLLSKLPAFSANFFCSAFTLHAVERLLGFQLSFVCNIGITVSIMVLAVASRMILDEIKKRGEARLLGAMLPPTVDGTLPGNVDILLEALKGDREGCVGDSVDKWFRQLGWTFNARILWQDKIVTAEPEHIKIILATHFDNFEKGPMFKDHMQSVLGEGIFNADGEMWKTMTRPFFSKERISHFEIFGRHADEAVRLVRDRTRAGFSVDIQDLVSRFTLDSATEFLFGHCVRVLSAGLPYPPHVTAGAVFKMPAETLTDPASLFSEAFSNAQMNGAMRSRYGSLWPLFEFWKDKTEDDMKIMAAFVDPILQDAVEKRRLNQEGGGTTKMREVGESDSLLDHLLNFTEDTTFLRFEILNIMIAGRDTTAATLAFAMYCLAEHPEYLHHLREEILSVVGSTRRPTYEDLKEMKFLRAVINETMRLYPPVPLDSRSNINATALPTKTPGGKPWYLPAGTRVVYSVFSMHRRTDLWGPDAALFDPNRFLDARASKYLSPHPFIFLPFNAGPRICLGQQFAYNEASFMLVRLLQAFDGVELAPDVQPGASRPLAAWAAGGGERREGGEGKRVEKVWVKSHLTIYAKDGLWVRLKEASHTELD